MKLNRYDFFKIAAAGVVIANSYAILWAIILLLTGENLHSLMTILYGVTMLILTVSLIVYRGIEK